MFLSKQSMWEKFQSVSGHITEMAFLRVLNDLLLTADSGSPAILVLLNLFAAFDTVDSKILLSRLVYVTSRAVVGNSRP